MSETSPDRIPTPRNPLDIVRALHQQQAEHWNFYGIAAPSFEEVGVDTLMIAYEAAMTLIKARPKLAPNVGLLLVPPSELLTTPVSEELRAKQGRSFADVVSFPYSPPEFDRWRTLVVDNNRHAGMYLGSPAGVEARGDHIVEGYDTRALGVHELSALSLTQSLDRSTFAHTWVLNPRDRQPDESFPVSDFQPDIVTFKAVPSMSDSQLGIRVGVEIEAA